MYVPGMESVGVMMTIEMRSNGSPVESMETLARDCVDGLAIDSDPRTGVLSIYLIVKAKNHRQTSTKQTTDRLGTTARCGWFDGTMDMTVAIATICTTLSSGSSTSNFTCETTHGRSFRTLKHIIYASRTH